MAILNPSKAEAVEALITLQFYFRNLAHAEMSRKLKLNYAEKAYDFEVSASTLEKYGPQLL